MKNKTQIFKNYQEFKNRPNKDVNGVTQELVDEMVKGNPNYDYIRDNATNTGCWNCYRCRECKDCISCKFSFDCSDCTYCNSCQCCTQLISAYDILSEEFYKKFPNYYN